MSGREENTEEALPPPSPQPVDGCFSCLACRLVGRLDTELSAVKRRMFFNNSPDQVFADSDLDARIRTAPINHTGASPCNIRNVLRSSTDASCSEEDEEEEIVDQVRADPRKSPSIFVEFVDDINKLSVAGQSCEEAFLPCNLHAVEDDPPSAHTDVTDVFSEGEDQGIKELCKFFTPLEQAEPAKGASIEPVSPAPIRFGDPSPTLSPTPEPEKKERAKLGKSPSPIPSPQPSPEPSPEPQPGPEPSETLVRTSSPDHVTPEPSPEPEPEPEPLEKVLLASTPDKTSPDPEPTPDPVDPLEELLEQL